MAPGGLYEELLMGTKKPADPGGGVGAMGEPAGLSDQRINEGHRMTWLQIITLPNNEKYVNTTID